MRRKYSMLLSSISHEKCYNLESSIFSGSRSSVSTKVVSIHDDPRVHQLAVKSEIPMRTGSYRSKRFKGYRTNTEMVMFHKVQFHCYFNLFPIQTSSDQLLPSALPKFSQSPECLLAVMFDIGKYTYCRATHSFLCSTRRICSCSERGHLGTRDSELQNLRLRRDAMTRRACSKLRQRLVNMIYACMHWRWGFEGVLTFKRVEHVQGVAL